MKFNCPHCNHEYNLTAARPGQKAKCKECRQIFRIPKPPIQIEPQPLKITPEKITPDRIRQTAKTFFLHLWNRQPAAFRTGFITTLGVLSALMLTWYLYGRVFYRPAANTMDSIKSTLALVELYPSSELTSGILRGRALKEMQFSPDINDPYIFLSCWFDADNRFVGVLAKYYGTIRGESTGIKSDSMKNHKNYCVLSGFEKLTNLYVSLENASFIKDEKNPYLQSEDAVFLRDSWGIVVTRMKTGHKMDEFSEKIAKIWNPDTTIYYYILTAQNW